MEISVDTLQLNLVTEIPPCTEVKSDEVKIGTLSKFGGNGKGKNMGLKVTGFMGDKCVRVALMSGRRKTGLEFHMNRYAFAQMVAMGRLRESGVV